MSAGAEPLSGERDRAGPASGSGSSYRRGLAFGLLSFGSLAVLGVASSIAVARVYGIEVVGQYALAFAPAGALAYLSSVREQAALVKELSVLKPREPRVTGLFAAVLAFSFGLTVAVTVPVGLATYFLFNGPIDHPELFAPAAVLLAGFIVVGNTTWNVDMVFSAFHAGRELFWVRLLQAVSYLALALAAGAAWGTIWGLVLATVGSFATSLVHRALVARRFMRGRISAEELREGFRTLPELIKFGAKIAPGVIAGGISTQAGVWVLGAFGSVAMVGAYNRAWMLAERLNDVSHRITEMLFPTLVARRASADREGFDRVLVDSLRYSAAGLLLLAAVGGGVAPGIMTLYGPGFSQAADALAIVLLLPALGAMAAIAGVAFYALDRPLVTTWVAGGRLVLTLILTVVLSLWFGVNGTAMAVVFGAVLEVVWLLACLRSHFSQRPRVLWPARERLALLLAYGGGLFAARLVDVSLAGAVGLLVGMVSGAAAFVGMLLAMGAVNSRDRNRLASLSGAMARHRERGQGRAGRASEATGTAQGSSL